jgi:hypothetical protein
VASPRSDWTECRVVGIHFYQRKQVSTPSLFYLMFLSRKHISYCGMSAL